MKKLILFFTYFLITSCVNNSKQAHFQINNENNISITNVNISNGVNEIYIDTIKANTNKSILLKFKNIPRIDGGYKLNYKLNSEYFFRNFGYYTNGVPSNSIYKLVVKNDTIIVSESMK